MTSEKIRQYFIFNIGKSYTFVDVHVKPRSHRPLRRHTTTYDGLISVIADHWGILVCNRATSWCDVARRRSHQGSSRDVLGVCMMFKNLVASPSIVEYRKIILLSPRGHTTLYNVILLYELKTSHDVPQGCAMIARKTLDCIAGGHTDH